MKGVTAANYIDGRKSAKHFCVEGCGREITYPNWLYGQKRCLSCSNHIKLLKLWKNKKFREERIKINLKSFKFTKSKPEKFLIKLFKHLKLPYKFVGNGSFWIKFKKFNFNPDFIDIKNKKIIEMFGDYWHNRVDNKKRDKIRIKGYIHQNYKTLIIWEHELKDLDKLIIKLKEF